MSDALKRSSHQQFYIVGPMAGRENLNLYKFVGVQKYLGAKHGFTSIIPHDIEPYDHGADPCPEGFKRNPNSKHAECCYARGDLYYMLRYCAAVVVLPGWNASVGSRLEVNVAAQCGMPILFITRTEMHEIMLTTHHKNRAILKFPEETLRVVNGFRTSQGGDDNPGISIIP